MPEPQVRDPGEPETSFDKRNLPVPVQRSTDAASDGEGLLGRLTRALFGWKAGSIRADLEVVLEAGASGETGFSPEERTLLKNILGLRERRVWDVMVPRSDIIAVQQDITLGELVRVFESAGHSRLVVYNDTLDDPIGMVHIRDLVAFMSARAQLNTQRRPSLRAGLDLKAIDLAVPLSSTEIMRSVLFVPPSMPAIDLLAKMQATRIHLALVIDEYGGTDGLVSIEDIVEQIVGEIEDEHDTDAAPTVLAQRDGSFIADARASLEDVTKLVGAEFDVGEAAADVDTLGGFLVTQIGRVPVRGELVPGPGQFEIEVLDADPRRVKKVRIHRGRRRPGLNRDGRRRDADADTARALPAPPLAPPVEPQSSRVAQEPTSETASPGPTRQS
jgi:CBS domain containing-hemolysin-like protein